ncbi:hypothetical protein [Chitinophaga sp. S165]|uniref:hypothetical protein n=1 Tax=Chitinophaga sp. S165 TaxID=2135462 RepID=UPI000D70E35E|nr:hypothetical protein [Chitinophaga sp. S165]PWV56325.1 hypothetical protein C7475_101840 [Chitinophaga sp. S165]
MNNDVKNRRSIRRWIIFFMIALVLSGATAFPLETELEWVRSWWPDKNAGFYYWLTICYEAISSTNKQYPILAYGYDWMAFAHIVIAISFIGPLRDPVRNIWVIEFGMIACVLVIPLALIAGPVREIPVFWRMIDCSFGVFGIVPLMIVHRKIKQLGAQ